MTEDQAEAVAKALGGDTWQSGGGMWMVLIRRADGRIVGIDDESVVEYEAMGAEAEEIKVVQTIHFNPRGPASEVDENGHMWILGLPVEPDMLTIANLISEEEDDLGKID